MPGFALKNLLDLRRSAAHRNNTAHRTTALPRMAVTVLAVPLSLCLGVISTVGIRAESTGLPPARIQPLPAVHLTDEQNQLGSGQLSPASEAISQTNALYADAICGLTENPTKRTLEQLRQVVSLDPHFADAQVKIASLLIQSGQIQSALEQLQTAATANPKSLSIETMLAYALRVNGRTEEALRLGRAVLTKDPSQAMAMRVLLEIAAEQHDLAGGVLHIKDILKNEGNAVTSSAWLTLAKLYLEIGREDPNRPTTQTLRTLLPIYQQAAAKPQPDVEALTLLADTYQNLGNKREALKTLQQASALDPVNVDIILHSADLESDLGEKTKALKHYEKAYMLNPALTGLREILGRLYLENQQYDDASRLLQKSLADSPQNYALGIDLGIAYIGARQPVLAQQCFDQVFSSPSCPPEAYLKLAVYQLAHKEIKDAGKTVTAARKQFPQSASVCFYEAVQHRYEKNYAAALASLAQEKSLATGSEADAIDLNYYLEYALVMNLAGKKEGIESLLNEGLTKFPNSSDLMNELAYFWADQGSHLPEADALSKRAIELDPDNGPIQDTRGWVYFQLGEVKDALPYLQRAAFLTNNDPVVLQHIGDAYLKLGQRSEALAAWRHALEKDPHNGDLANRIDAAQAQANNAHSRSALNP